ncbi:MAG: sugar-transfer associated ATP-grasp domain-containing protein [Butyricimonas faecihominis]
MVHIRIIFITGNCCMCRCGNRDSSIPGIDTNYKTYLCHPYSSKQIIGYKIEHWDKILAVVTEASRVLPQVRHVGWDVVIGKNSEIIILEGNSRPDPILVQLTNRKGIWNDYKRNIGK